jgi:hypothetical protein
MLSRVAFTPTRIWLTVTVVAGCATSTQSIRIDCVPAEVSVYVDGRLLEESPDVVLLRTDAPHKIFVKGPGYEPRLVVLEPELDRDGRLHFDTNELCIEVVPIGQHRELEVEVERDGEVR